MTSLGVSSNKSQCLGAPQTRSEPLHAAWFLISCPVSQKASKRVHLSKESVSPLSLGQICVPLRPPAVLILLGDCQPHSRTSLSPEELVRVIARTLGYSHRLKPASSCGHAGFLHSGRNNAGKKEAEKIFTKKIPSRKAHRRVYSMV